MKTLIKKLRRGSEKMEFGNNIKEMIDIHNNNSDKYVIRKTRMSSTYAIQKINGYKEYETITNLSYSELEKVSYVGDLAALIYIHVSRVNKETLDGRWATIKRFFKRLFNK